MENFIVIDYSEKPYYYPYCTMPDHPWNDEGFELYNLMKSRFHQVNFDVPYAYEKLLEDLVSGIDKPLMFYVYGSKTTDQSKMYELKESIKGLIELGFEFIPIFIDGPSREYRQIFEDPTELVLFGKEDVMFLKNTNEFLEYVKSIPQNKRRQKLVRQEEIIPGFEQYFEEFTEEALKGPDVTKEEALKLVRRAI